MPQLFNEVWYFPRAKKWYGLNLLAFDDVGALTVLDNGLEFSGKKGAVLISNIRRVSYGKYGRDFINHLVKVEYGDGTSLSTALFADGSSLGWGGVLGGTKQIYEVVKNLDPGGLPIP